MYTEPKRLIYTPIPSHTPEKIAYDLRHRIAETGFVQGADYEYPDKEAGEECHVTRLPASLYGALLQHPANKEAKTAFLASFLFYTGAPDIYTYNDAKTTDEDRVLTDLEDFEEAGCMPLHRAVEKALHAGAIADLQRQLLQYVADGNHGRDERCKCHLRFPCPAPTLQEGN